MCKIFEYTAEKMKRRQRKDVNRKSRLRDAREFSIDLAAAEHLITTTMNKVEFFFDKLFEISNWRIVVIHVCFMCDLCAVFFYFESSFSFLGVCNNVFS